MFLYPGKNPDKMERRAPTGPDAMSDPVALVLERNKLVLRRIARVLGCAGFDVRGYEAPEKVEAEVLDGAQLAIADAFDADLVMRWLRERPRMKAVLYSGEPLDRLLSKALEEPRLVALMG